MERLGIKEMKERQMELGYGVYEDGCLIDAFPTYHQSQSLLAELKTENPRGNYYTQPCDIRN
jgi:hypothetical protein